VAANLNEDIDARGADPCGGLFWREADQIVEFVKRCLIGPLEVVFAFARLHRKADDLEGGTIVCLHDVSQDHRQAMEPRIGQ